MALDDTSYPHLCTAHLSRPYVPMLCLWVPSHWPWNPSPQTGAGRQAPRHRCPRPPRRGTTQDGAGYRRMAQDGQEHVGVFLLRSASIPWDTMTHDGLFMLFEFHRIPTSSHPEGRESWTPDAAHRSKVEQVNCVAASGAPLRAFGPRDPGEVEAPGKQRYPLPRLWVRPPELPCRRAAPEREQAGWYGQGLVRHWTRWQGV